MLKSKLAGNFAFQDCGSDVATISWYGWELRLETLMTSFNGIPLAGGTEGAGSVIL